MIYLLLSLPDPFDIVICYSEITREIVNSIVISKLGGTPGTDNCSFCPTLQVLDKTQGQGIKTIPRAGPVNTNISCARCILGHAVAQWLRHCATNRKVVDSIPDGVNGIFH
jgi:hypothetical protein